MGTDSTRPAGASEIDELEKALKETILNVERLAERAERVLGRAREWLSRLDMDDDS